jgi:para-nitrobenzyl esterase
MRALLLTTGMLLLLVIPQSVGAASEAADQIVLDSGPVIGRNADGLRLYLGVPYAAPPVGELRWAPPQPVTPWTTPRNASAFGSMCSQPIPDMERNTSEDCLYLNVWTPAAGPRDRLPVMVWIHGGGFQFGSASSPEYDGAALAKQGVVVASLNYRLGPLGYFVYSPKDGGPGAEGNYGLLDQIAALSWVRKNIAAFGGDPDNVTIFGQSAGSRSVSLLTLCPRAEGLFRRGIAQSGGPIIGSEYLNPVFNGDKATLAGMGGKLAARLGCDASPDAMACLRRKSPAEVLTATATSTSLFVDTLLFAPVFDGRVLPVSPQAVLNDPKRRGAPMIVGSTGNEGAAYIKDEKNLTLARYETFLAARFGDQTQAARKLFPAATNAEVPGAIDRLVTVAANAQPARLMARSLARSGSPSYLHRFTRRPGTAQAKACGAFHGVDLAYVFGNMPAGAGYDDLDRELSKRMMGYWVNFAKTGDPNGPGLAPWPAYDPASDQSLNFGDTVQTERGLYKQECDFIDQVSRFRQN